MEELEVLQEEPLSYLILLQQHRVSLVNTIISSDWILDSLIRSGYFTMEDKELVESSCTTHSKIRKLLDIISSKGEESAECFFHILHEGSGSNTDLQSLLQRLQFQLPKSMQCKLVIIRDAVIQYSEKLKEEIKWDTKFLMSYVSKGEALLEEVYTDTVIEVVNEADKSLGNVTQFEELFDRRGVQNEDAETVLIIGDAGTGKTVLLKKLQNVWAKNELNMDSRFFFKFSCRMFTGSKKDEHLSLKDLLFSYNGYPDKDVDEVFAYILQNPHTIILSFDGFDEISSSYDVYDVPEAFTPLQSTSLLSLLMSLLQGKLLKGSKKILSTRTGTEVQRRIVRKKIILKGFSKEKLLNYLKTFFKDEDTQHLVLNQLEASPHLCSLCSVPLFCWITFKCYQHFFSSYNAHQLPDCNVTLTDVYLLMLEVILNRCPTENLMKKRTRSTIETFTSRKETLLSLGKLALRGVENACFVFDQDEITSLNISKEDLQFCFLRPVGHYDGCGNQSTYEFLHLTLQSFFAALLLVIDSDIEKGEHFSLLTKASTSEKSKISISEMFSSSWDTPTQRKGGSSKGACEHFQFTRLFICGLLSKSKQYLLQNLTSPKSLKTKRVKLTSCLTKCLQSHLQNLPETKIGNCCKVQVLPRFLWLLRCVYETQNENLAELAAKRIKSDFLKMTYCNVCPADCSAIAFLLKHVEKPISVELDNNNINDYGVKELVPCLSKLRLLRMSVNQITDTGVRILTEELIKHQMIEMLGLYKNQISDVGARDVAHLMECCPTLIHLKIGGNQITCEGGTVLAEAIRTSSTISEVGLTENQITVHGASLLLQSLQENTSIKELCLKDNKFSTEEAKFLKQEPRIIL
nr:PREDICTED: nucleotide-binding oligomerization domain-containing protein 1 isoform X2 [Latimeria chalumnae]|eukprot:XP_014343039.1 PREDICTED: nucleotide-binding oligomerization domain-containing protein 1 isoform X2 [Latimeria chalumnae]